jgi:hypothetical protein
MYDCTQCHLHRCVLHAVRVVEHTRCRAVLIAVVSASCGFCIGDLFGCYSVAAFLCYNWLRNLDTRPSLNRDI